MKKKYWIRIEEEVYNWVASKWEGSFTTGIEGIYKKVMEAKLSRQPIQETKQEETIQEESTFDMSRYSDNQIAFAKSLKLKSKNEYTDEDWFTIPLEKFLEVYHKDKENLRPLIIELS